MSLEQESHQKPNVVSAELRKIRSDALTRRSQDSVYRLQLSETHQALWRDLNFRETHTIVSSLWEAAIEENLIESILKQNLMTQDEINKIRTYVEHGKKPPGKLMDKFSIAVANVA